MGRQGGADSLLLPQITGWTNTYQIVVRKVLTAEKGATAYGLEPIVAAMGSNGCLGRDKGATRIQVIILILFLLLAGPCVCQKKQCDTNCTGGR